MYEKPPTAEYLATFGLTETDIDDVEVWPENHQTVIVFSCMDTQWRAGMNGPTGLDYSVLPEIWQRTKTPDEDRDWIFYDLRIMEKQALKVMREQAA